MQKPTFQRKDLFAREKIGPDTINDQITTHRIDRENHTIFIVMLSEIYTREESVFGN